MPNSWIQALTDYNHSLTSNKRAWVVPKKMSPGWIRTKDKMGSLTHKGFTKGEEYFSYEHGKITMWWEFRENPNDHTEFQFFWMFPQFCSEAAQQQKWDYLDAGGSPSQAWGKVTLFRHTKTLNTIYHEYQHEDPHADWQGFRVPRWNEINPSNSKVNPNQSTLRVRLYLDYFYGGEGEFKSPSGSVRFALDFCLNYLTSTFKADEDEGIYLWAYGNGIGGPHTILQERYANLLKLYYKMGFYPFLSKNTNSDISSVVEDNERTVQMNYRHNSHHLQLPSVYMVGEIKDVRHRLDQKFWDDAGIQP